MKGIILAAGRGSRMGALTNNQPKCFTVIKGKPLIEHQIDALRLSGIKDIAIITGYKSEMLIPYGTHHFHNEKWQETNMVYSLLCAKEWLNESDCIVSYSDIYYRFEIVKDLMTCDHEIAVAYDPNWLNLWSKRFENPLDDAETFSINESGCITEIGQKPQTIEEIQGQYMGLLKFKKGVFCKYTQGLDDRASRASMTEFLRDLITKNSVHIQGLENKHEWFEIDSLEDLKALSDQEKI